VPFLHVLRLPDAFQVDLWVMEAITSGLITAKIERVRELVIVTVCVEREFGDRQWERLKNSLGSGESRWSLCCKLCWTRALLPLRHSDETYSKRVRHEAVGMASSNCAELYTQEVGL